MTDPIKLAIEALSLVEEYGAPTLLAAVKVRDAAIALRDIKPPCQMCVRYYSLYEPETSIAGIRIVSKDACFATDCTNYDKFQALEPVCLTNLTNLTKEK